MSGGPVSQEQEETLEAVRIAKLERLRARGADPYPPRVHRTQSVRGALETLYALEARGGPLSTTLEVAVAGRLTALRGMGRATFADVQDGTGRVQLHFRRDVLGDEPYEMIKDADLGDFVQARGSLFRTKTGEPTVAVQSWCVIAKALRPPPEKWHGLQDVELRYRRRYLDLMTNAEVREVFRKRSKVISAVRRFMEARGFIEVETPVLEAHVGGAAARPFVTHYNALDEQRYLRIALELHLKRLIVGGFDKVFEIGRVFRNEGLSTKRNPEFTMLESYEAYADYHAVADMVEELVAAAAREVHGSTRFPYRETEIDVAPPWPRLAMRELLQRETGIDFLAVRDRQELIASARKLAVDVPESASWGKALDEVWSTVVEPNLIQPVFVLDYPVELSPLAKRKPGQPELVERFEAFAGGFEIANAYSELNDPLDQRARFEGQAGLRAAGEEEAETLDEDFLRALEQGMPPTGGLGIGIDRLLMVLLDQRSIRDVLLFPQLRTRADQG